MSKMICFCFNYTEEDILQDVLKNNGQSLILERIKGEKKKGGCQCHTKNPSGK
jgi:hypothetical protein